MKLILSVDPVKVPLTGIGASFMSGEVFNVCSGNVFSLQYALDMMAHIAGYKIEVKVNAAFVRQGEVRVLRRSNKKLCEKIDDLNWIPLEKTLRWMYES